MESKEYPKTENVFTRNDETYKLNAFDLRLPAFGQIKTWLVTEKVDGTNMRVCYDPKAGTVEIRGRSDKANIHGTLFTHMTETFTLEKMRAQFDEYLADQVELGTTVTLYGEGYGAGIQKGGGYSPTPQFRLFDVLYHRYHGLESWAQWETVVLVANGIECPIVPVVSLEMSMDEIVDFVMSGPKSYVAGVDGGSGLVIEGVVARTDPYLYTEHGSRVMFKLKGKDLS
jgi:hypothetical protein